MSRDQIERILWTAVAAIVGMATAPAVAGWIVTTLKLAPSSYGTVLGLAGVVLVTVTTLVKTYIAKRWGADTPAAWPNEGAE